MVAEFGREMLVERTRMGLVQAALGERRTAIDRYLRAFEAGRTPESTCAERLSGLDREVRRTGSRRRTGIEPA